MRSIRRESARCDKEVFDSSHIENKDEYFHYICYIRVVTYTAFVVLGTNFALIKIVIPKGLE
jgi:hypothetical protein